tara:strand:+ start:253 stop:372 length:120 start_codon:yes stop_codon:yes gene_type:complete
VAEHTIGNGGVGGSIPLGGTIIKKTDVANFVKVSYITKN